MIGAKSIEISSENLIEGMSTTPYLTDGGFSNETSSINLTAVPGLAYSQGPVTFATGTIAGALIASCEDPTPITGGFVRLLVDNLGNFYTLSGSTIANVHTDGTNPTKYTAGMTDMIGFAKTYGANGTVLTTNQVGIVSWIINANTFNDTFFSFTNQSGVPHPALVYQNNAYYGDGNVLYRQSAPDATPLSVLVLAAQQTIVTLGIDPGSGLMLISTVDGLNYSDTLNKVTMIQYYDGVSPQVRKQVITEDMITAFHPVGAILYVTYGSNVGYWSGSGVKFLRELNIQLVGANLAYKHHVSHIDTTLYVVEGSSVLAYGDVIRGKAPVFYYPFVAISAISMIANLGSEQLGVADVNLLPLNLLEIFSMADVSSVGKKLTFNSLRYVFSRPVVFNGIVIEYGVPLLTATNKGVVSIIDDNQVAHVIPMTSINGQYQAQGYDPTISSRSLQVNYVLDSNTTTQLPIRRMTVFYTDTDGHI